MKHGLFAAIAVAALAGCGGSMPFANGSSHLEASRRAPGAATILAIGEQGTKKEGVIEVFTAPFQSPPVRLRLSNTLSLGIAPNGDLIAASYGGTFVYDPPYKGVAPRKIDDSTLGARMLFDSANRLFEVEYFGAVEVFDPPYNGKPILTIEGPVELSSGALDAEDNLFLKGGDASVYECRSPKYKCKPLRNLGAVAIDKTTNDLYALRGSGSDGVEEFAPPYHAAPIAKTETSFAPSDIAVTGRGIVFVPGQGTRSQGYLAVFPHSLGGRTVTFPMEAYYSQIYDFSVAQDRALFVAAGTYDQPCLAIHPFPYHARGSYRCIKTNDPIYAVAAR